MAFSGLGGLGAVYPGFQEAEQSTADLQRKRLQNQQTQIDMQGDQLFARGLQLLYGDQGGQAGAGAPQGGAGAPSGQPPPQQPPAPAATPAGISGYPADKTAADYGSILPGGAQIVADSSTGGARQPPASQPPGGSAQTAAPGGAGKAPAPKPQGQQAAQPTGQQRGPPGPDNPPNLQQLIAAIVKGNPGASPAAIGAAIRSAMKMPYWNQQERMQMMGLQLQLREQAFDERVRQHQVMEDQANRRIELARQRGQEIEHNNAARLFEMHRRGDAELQRLQDDEKKALEKRSWQELQAIMQKERARIQVVAAKAQSEGADPGEMKALVAEVTKNINDAIDQYSRMRPGEEQPKSPAQPAQQPPKQPGAGSVVRKSTYDPDKGFSDAPAGP